eukprot:TRINITY_DN9861_c0_g1_i1.p1 TRINITY_DN9861_c0_g1~~TRINITY_DN9861_c0_g1_i1.p1  ORF type:complete len:248 (-),score=80.84 TRINITY_DN9861_c0_g1_i1:128-772(-)
MGSLLVKVPQILKIWSNKSAEGISISSFYWELVVYLLSCGYNIRYGNPFSTYGENAFMFFQSTILVFLCWSFSKGGVSIVEKITVLGGFGAMITLIALNLVPDRIYTMMAILSLVLLIMARLPQILINMKHKSTGQLSIITCFLNFAGCLARIFTTLREVSDVLVLATHLTGAALNGIIFLHFFIYKPAKGADAKTKTSPKKSPTKKTETKKER